jgi:arsenite methyltransferase
MPNLAIVPTFIREVLGTRSLRREPEPDLIMVDEGQVADYVEGGRRPGIMAAAYLFHSARISQTISGCRRVLDLGCGPATQLIEVAKLNPTIAFVGMDLSDTMLDAARAYAVSERCNNVTFLRGDITRLEAFGDKTVDGVISTMALHHLPTVGALTSCFREISRVLQPSGALYLADFGLLKSPRSVSFFVDANRPHQPQHFSVDFELSMKAAFLSEELCAIAGDLLPPRTRFYRTFQIPLLNLIKTPDRPLDAAQYEAFRDQRAQLPAKFRRQLDDIRLFFWLGGLRNDPFRPNRRRSRMGALESVVELTRLSR